MLHLYKCFALNSEFDQIKNIKKTNKMKIPSLTFKEITGNSLSGSELKNNSV